MVMWAPKKGGRWCDELFSSMGAEYKDATLTYVDFLARSMEWTCTTKGVTCSLGISRLLACLVLKQIYLFVPRIDKLCAGICINLNGCSLCLNKS